MAANRRPDPEPLETNDVVLVTAGAVLWAVVLVVLVVLSRRSDDEALDRWVWVAAAGTFLGAVGVRYVRRRRAARATGADSAKP